MEVVNALITIQGEEKAATVPSDKLRIVGGFELVAGQATVLTLDFDAEKSVVLRGRQEPLLKPVVKLLARKGGQPKAEAKEVSEAPAPTPTLTPTPTATPTATATSAGLQTVQITTSGFTFVPNLVTVTKGETVRFILTVPDFQHTLTFQVTNKSVDLTLTQPGTLTSEPVPFNEVQQVRFVCRFHEPFGMAGTINVVER
ncbi:MAG: hypothetical protein HYY31_07135 [Chloroflexi bacterium]|nr:hypothetical protein [Chloroflexota bacterium]